MKKKYIGLIVCLGISIGLFICFKNMKDIENLRSMPQYVLIDQLHYWKYVDNDWINIDSVTDSHIVENEINWNKFDVYIDNKYYNTFDYVMNDYQEFYFDENTKSYEIEQEKILLNHDSYLVLKDFSVDILSSDDINIVNSFMNKYDYSFDDVIINIKYTIDKDNVIYIVSNYNDDISESGTFYFAFYRSYNKNYLLVNNNDVTNIYYYKLYGVLNIMSKHDNIILSYGCEDSVCYDMYEYNRGKYVKVVGD